MKMNKIYLIVLLNISGCGLSSASDFNAQPSPDCLNLYEKKILIEEPSTQKYEMPEISLQELNNCITDRIYADAIPSGYVFDPNCPPEIIHPPKLILPNDISPVIR